MSSNLGSLIRVFRIRKGLSQAQLADQIGVSQGAIGQWERGEFRPRGKYFKALHEALGLSVDLLQTEAEKDEVRVGEIELSAETQPDTPEQIHRSMQEHLAYVMNSEALGRLMHAEHKAKSAEFENAFFTLLSHYDDSVRRHVAVDGPAIRHWIVDCLTHRSVIEIKHPTSYVGVEDVIAHILWRLVVFRTFMGSENSYVAIVRRPPDEKLPARGVEFFEKKIAVLVMEAHMVGITLLIVDSPEQAVKAVEDLEQDRDRRRSQEHE